MPRRFLCDLMRPTFRSRRRRAARFCFSLLSGPARLSFCVGSMGKLTSVQFTVEDFGDDPIVVTELIGFEPTATAVCGWSSLPAQRTWLAELAAPVRDPLHQRIAALVRMLESHADGVRKVAAKYRARISICVDDREWISPYDPGGYRSGEIEISPEMAGSLSRLGLGITIRVFAGLDRSKA